MSDAEYPALLKEVYKRADIVKPKNVVGLAKDLPPAEMEALLVASITVADDAMQQLAVRRGVAVRDYLAESRDPDRAALPRRAEDRERRGRAGRRAPISSWRPTEVRRVGNNRRHDLRAGRHRGMPVVPDRLRRHLRRRVDRSRGEPDRPLPRLAARDGLRIRFVIDTHTHADHFSAARRIAEQLGAMTVMHRASPAPGVAMRVDDGESIVHRQAASAGAAHARPHRRLDVPGRRGPRLHRRHAA